MSDNIVVPAEGFGGQTKEQVEAALAAQNAPKGAPGAAGAAGTALLAGKYKTPDELVKGYKAAESELGRLRSELAALKASTPSTPAVPAAPAAPAQDAEPDTLAITDPPAADPKGDPSETVVNFDEFAAEFASSGALSEASYEKLQAQGLSRKMVDTYIAGVQAAQKAALDTADRIAGGPEARKQVLAWAATNLTKQERDAFNATVEGADPAAREMVFRGLVSRWKEAGGGVEPNLIQAEGRSPDAGSNAFANFRELSAAMKDPRYTTDPRYRAEVEARAAISKL